MTSLSQVPYGEIDLGWRRASRCGARGCVSMGYDAWRLPIVLQSWLARLARSACSDFGLLPTTKWIPRSPRAARDAMDGDRHPSVVQGAAAV